MGRVHEDQVRSSDHAVQHVGLDDLVHIRQAGNVLRIHAGDAHAVRPRPDRNLETDTAHADDQCVLAVQFDKGVGLALSAAAPWHDR